MRDFRVEPLQHKELMALLDRVKTVYPEVAGVLESRGALAFQIQGSDAVSIVLVMRGPDGDLCGVRVF